MDLKVFITTGESTCGECGVELGRRAWITLVEDKGALCLSCADLDHLYFLPTGSAALPRRSRKYSNGPFSGCQNPDEEAVRLAVTAHVRHVETKYDSLLSMGIERWEARNQVAGMVDQVLARWEMKSN